MKKVLLAAIVSICGSSVFGANVTSFKAYSPAEVEIPQRFASSHETAVLEWGCPIEEIIQATSSADAIKKIGMACMEDVKRAATEKPGVFEVINVSVIWPDVAVSETN